MEKSERHPCLSCNWTCGFCVLLLCVLLLCVPVLLVVFARTWSSSGKEDSVKGQFLEESFSRIVRQRCINFTKNLFPELSNKDCTEVEEAFRSAFISKDPCNITEQDYQPLMGLVNQTLPCDKVVFWSKTRRLAQDYTQTRGDLITLEDTLLGYMADGLTWCSARGSAEVKTESCPERSERCLGTATSVFWDAASKWFAEKACGEVQVILNGSITNTYNRRSVFVSVEVHELNPMEVSTLHAWVIHERRGQTGDLCSSYSIKNLELILRKKYIKFTCQEASVHEFLQCSQNPKDLHLRYKG